MIPFMIPHPPLEVRFYRWAAFSNSASAALHPALPRAWTFNSRPHHCVIGHLFSAWQGIAYEAFRFLVVIWISVATSCFARIAPPEVVESHSRSCRFLSVLVSWRDLDEVSLGHHRDGRGKKASDIGGARFVVFSSLLKTCLFCSFFFFFFLHMLRIRAWRWWKHISSALYRLCIMGHENFPA
ncbi:hypothetical protein CDEST_00962 [Colletotrichum destructivum]|uniref:Uncharacterized protein n=1 Tax=Colletotrichum destructivum TaxID=34406 RepID=A0AAX4HXN0_9PEZI|nr:hypothetical protein CDEST_00962 [Colletotrichum destructivum]